MAKENRKRNWAFVVYPDSLPENWLEILQDQHVPGFVSPLHSDDVNADGTLKKPHYHVLLTFQGQKSYDQVKEITNALNAPGPQPCKDTRAYARYLCHLDNPEKAQYVPGEVVNLAGADYLEVIQSMADVQNTIGEIMDWCIDQRIDSFYRLSNYARKHRPDWFRVITTRNTIFLVHWLRSMEWDNNRTEQHESYVRMHLASQDMSVENPYDGYDEEAAADERYWRENPPI